MPGIPDAYDARGRGHDFHATEPDVLDADMTASDIVFALEHLAFRANGLSTLRLEARCAIISLQTVCRRRSAARSSKASPPGAAVAAEAAYGVGAIEYHFKHRLPSPTANRL
jgi:hypothetical protein